MQGRSHLLVGLAAGVVIDSFFHLSGNPLTGAHEVSLNLLVDKGVYYCAIALGALLPDIDNARSTLGHKLGIISKEIQKLAGHRTFFHSLLGLAFGSLLAIGFESVVSSLLASRGYAFPARFVSSSHIFFFGVLFGCIFHIAADGLTLGGVPLLWPYKKRFGFPPNRHWRFRTGSWPEFVIVWSVIILVAAGIYNSIIVI
jgi:inner membrane protein